MDPEKLLYKINSGKSLKPNEIEEVAALLQWIEEDSGMAERISMDDVYSLLLVLGKAKATKHRHLIAKQLERTDALTVSMVLEILCVDWGETEEYLERLVQFALGVSWDGDGDVQQSAIRILGEYLFVRAEKKTFPEPASCRVLELLFHVFEDSGLEIWTRQAAYYSLLRAGRKDWEEIPPDCKLLNFEKGSPDINEEALFALRGKLPQSSSGESGKSSSLAEASCTGIR